MTATFMGEQYQQHIFESLEDVEKQSRSLIEQAQMSASHEMSYTMRTILVRE